MKRYTPIVVLLLWGLWSMPAQATTYYLATAVDGGDDHNDGRSPGEPWWSPDHDINCGDVIIALASPSYDQDQFTFGRWGNVNCPSRDNVAWLKCVTFAACKLTSTGQNAMWVTSSYWGVQGWEVTATGGQAICFNAFPPAENGAGIHHIVFANNIANGCYGSGFLHTYWGTASVDYFVVVGNIAYNAAQQSAQCGSGIATVAPKASDSLPGTHIYIAGNYTWNTFNPQVCAGGTPTDGNGIIVDSLDVFSYDQQVVVENNISFLNGGSGLRVVVSTLAPIYFKNNTSFGNSRSTHHNMTWCGEIVNQSSNRVVMTNNIARTIAATGCGGWPTYGFFIVEADGTNSVNFNMGYGVTGSNHFADTSRGFTMGANNVFGTDPNFASAPSGNPGAPNCSRKLNVPDCVAPIIAGFVARVPAASGKGYQPITASANNPLFPQWLCNVNLPSGIVTLGCAAETNRPSPPTITEIIVR